MMLLNILLMLCLGFRVGSGVGLHGFHFHGLEEPDNSDTLVSENTKEGWISQPLDHFNARDNRTWMMRYYENANHVEKGGPILVMIGGEWEIATGFLKSGLMYELAVRHKAMMYYTEHRYYGKSMPTADVSSKNLQYLSVDQALADLARFIEVRKKAEGLEDSPVIVFGGSYAGSVAAWARLKYPHLIQGALASSAPVFAKADFYEYYEVVTKSLGGYSQKCTEDVKAAFTAVEELLVAPGGLQKLKTYFNLCYLPKVNNPDDVAYFMNALAETFAGIVQYDKVVDGKRKIATCCEDMTASYLGSPLQRLARLVSDPKKCLDNSYDHFVARYGNEHQESDTMRQWFYQTCTEFGYYQTTNSTKSIFGTLFPLRFWENLCVALYGDYYNANLLNTQIDRTNLMYGGLRPDLRRVIFTNGKVDPWHALSVLEDLNESSPAILIEGSSHCSDLYKDERTDPPALTQARERVREIISSWITS